MIRFLLFHILVLGLLLGAHGQSIEDWIDYEIKLHSSDSFETIFVANPIRKIDYDLLTAQIGFEQKDSCRVLVYSNLDTCTLLYSVNFINSKMHGIEQCISKNGFIKEYKTWSNGLLNGAAWQLTDNRISYFKNFSKGKLVGRNYTYEYFNIDSAKYHLTRIYTLNKKGRIKEMIESKSYY
jgi:hypothetical protein